MRSFSKQIIAFILAAGFLLAPSISKIMAQTQEYCSDPKLASYSNGVSDETVLCISINAQKTTEKKTFFNLSLEKTKEGYGQFSNEKSAKWELYNGEFDVVDETGAFNEPPAEVSKIDYGNTPEIKLNTVEKQTLVFTTNKELESGKEYFMAITLSKNHPDIQTTQYGSTQITVRDYTILTTITFTAGTGGGITDTSFGDRNGFDKQGGGGIAFGCSLNPMSPNLPGCIASILYYIFFVPLAEITRLAAKFLDFFVYYSTNSDSYSASFVTRAWSAVRDIANIFFIITLLYIAIKTVLGLNVSNNKRLIGMVIVIALVINFSLFTTKIVIDASNILAKVFYNNIVPIKQDGTHLGPEDKGEKSISVGLVAQFNPTEIITNPANNPGNFIVVTILCIALMAYMIYIFLSISVLFVARVVSLWLSMMFSPVAFISYAVPFKVPGFGHSEWWENLLKNAMLAPLFIFFLYIIIMFGDFFHLIEYDIANSTDWLDGAMKTLIPFAVIFILLQQAKKLAVQYSGEMGKAIQGAAAAVGGLALGGVALGTAAMGRGVIGRTMAASSRSEAAIKYGKERIAFNEKLREWEKTQKGEKPTWKEHAKDAGVSRNLWAVLGHKINKSQKEAGEISHARHELHEAKKQAGLEGVSDDNLSGVEAQRIKDKFIGSKKSEIERDIRRGYDDSGKYIEITMDNEKDEKGNPLKVRGEGGFKAVRRETLIDEMKKKRDPKEFNSTTDELTDLGKKKIEDQLNQEFNVKIKELTVKIGEHKFEHIKEEAAQNISIGTKIAARSTSGSYDVRNLPGLKADKMDGLSTKATMGLIAAVAAGIRGGLKSSLNIDAGTPKKDTVEDLKNLINSSLKKVKVDVNLGGDGHGGGGGDHGGGHGGDHGGGHGGGHH